MENFLYDVVHEISMIFKDNPFYMNIWIVIGTLFLGFILLMVIICYEAVRNSIFSIEFIFFICTVKCIIENISDSRPAGIVLLVTACITFILMVLMFLLICACQEDYYGSGFSLFFVSLIDGFINLFMISATITIVAIPVLFALGAKSWNED